SAATAGGSFKSMYRKRARASRFHPHSSVDARFRYITRTSEKLGHRRIRRFQQRDAWFEATPGSRQMQHQAVAGPAEESTAKKNLCAQRGWLAIGVTGTSALEFSKQIEQ